MCCTLTGLWYGQEKLKYAALLILIECCTVNICAADIFWKVISLYPKRYTSADSMWLRFCFTVPPTTFCPFITDPFLGSLALSYNSQRLFMSHLPPPTRYWYNPL
jgi:hypothetical protein